MENGSFDVRDRTVEVMRNTKQDSPPLRYSRTDRGGQYPDVFEHSRGAPCKYVRIRGDRFQPDSQRVFSPSNDLPNFPVKPGKRLDCGFYSILLHTENRGFADAWIPQNFLATPAHGLGVPSRGSGCRHRALRLTLAERTSRGRAFSCMVGLQSRWLYPIVFHALPGRH